MQLDRKRQRTREKITTTEPTAVEFFSCLPFTYMRFTRSHTNFAFCLEPIYEFVGFISQCLFFFLFFFALFIVDAIIDSLSSSSTFSSHSVCGWIKKLLIFAFQFQIKCIICDLVADLVAISTFFFRLLLLLLVLACVWAFDN